MGSSNPWPPYKDCSLGICSVYCPQFCYVIFPPPPPSNNNNSEDSRLLSPLVIAVIGILASVFLLVTYYLVVTRYCRRRERDGGGVILAAQEESSRGMEERVIKAITVYKYKKGEGLVEGTDCSVCLTEFEDNESLRLMPKCTHAFHLPCIDTWLKSHSSCPLCRSSVLPSPPPVVTVTAHASTHQPHALLIICDSSSSSSGSGPIVHHEDVVGTIPTSPKHQ